MGPRLRCKHSWIHLGELCTVPWVPEVFLACGGNFRCWPKADTTSVVGRSHERQPRLKSLWHPGYVSGDLQLVLQHCCETGLKAMLRFSPPTFKPVFTKHVSCKLRDYWLLIFSQPPTTFWFVSRQASLIREWSNAQHRHSTSSFCSSNVAKQVTRFRCLFPLYLYLKTCLLTWAVFTP